jgi:hypothetical protein
MSLQNVRPPLSKKWSMRSLSPNIYVGGEIVCGFEKSSPFPAAGADA